MKKSKIDNHTMGVNCSLIFQEVQDMFIVAKSLNVDLELIVDDADELKTHKDTASWDGLGRFAYNLVHNDRVWDLLPDSFELSYRIWVKGEQKAVLMNCYDELGGIELFNAVK